METAELTLDEQIDNLQSELLEKISQIIADSSLANSTKILKIRKLTAISANEIRELV